MRVEPEDAQQPREAREIAVDHPLQVEDAASAPLLQLLRREQIHADEDVHRGHGLAPCENGSHGALDLRVKRIVAIRPQGCRFPAACRLPHQAFPRLRRLTRQLGEYPPPRYSVNFVPTK